MFFPIGSASGGISDAMGENSIRRMLCTLQQEATDNVATALCRRELCIWWASIDCEGHVDETEEDMQDTQARRQEAFPDINWTGADYRQTEQLHWAAMQNYFRQVQRDLNYAIFCQTVLRSACGSDL